jgi:hypothetical protein
MSDDLIKRIQEKCAGRDRWYVMNAAEDGYCMDFDWGYDADRWMDDRLRENPDYIKRNGYHVVKKRSFTSAEELANEASALIEQQVARIAELEAQITTVAPAVDAQPVAWRHKATKILRNDSIAKGADFEPADWEPLYTAAQSEGLRKDAERYRHLRQCNSGSLVIVQIIGTGEDDQIVLTEEHADEAIDAALSQHTGEKDD